MSGKDNRFWNIAGVIIIILWVAFMAYQVGHSVGSRKTVPQEFPNPEDFISEDVDGWYHDGYIDGFHDGYHEAYKDFTGEYP